MEPLERRNHHHTPPPREDTSKQRLVSRSKRPSRRAIFLARRHRATVRARRHEADTHTCLSVFTYGNASIRHRDVPEILLALKPLRFRPVLAQMLLLTHPVPSLRTLKVPPPPGISQLWPGLSSCPTMQALDIGGVGSGVGVGVGVGVGAVGVEESPPHAANESDSKTMKAINIFLILVPI